MCVFPGSDAIPSHVMWPLTPAGRQHLAWRCRTCCLRANENPRPLRCLIFRGSIPHPMQSLCTLRDHCRQGSRNTRYQAGAAPYLDRSSTGWIAPACLAHSFNHLVSAQKEGFRDFQPDCPGRRIIDDEVEFGRPLDRNVAWLRPPQNLVDIVGGTPEQVGKVWSIRDQASRFDNRPSAMHGRQSCGGRPGVNANPVRDYERVVDDVKCIRTTIERFEGRRDILGSPDFKVDDIEAECARSPPNLRHLRHSKGVVNIGHDRQPAETGNEIAQNFESLASKIGLLVRQAGDVATRSRQIRDQAGANRVPQYEDDRNDRCRLLCCDGCVSTGDNDINLEQDELGGDLCKALAASVRPAILGRNGAPLGPPEFVKPLHKSGGPWSPGRGCRRAKIPDGRQLARLLCARRQRPRYRAAECGQQSPPSDGDYHTPLPCVRCVEGRIPRHRRAVFTFKKGRLLVASTSVSASGDLPRPTHAPPLSTGPHPWRVGELATAQELPQQPDELEKRFFRIRRFQAVCR